MKSMNLKLTVTALLTKLLSFAAQKLGGGTDRPGSIALKLYPQVLKALKYDGKIIAVTGSNGKTTTSNLIAHVLREQGYSVVNNAKEAAELMSYTEYPPYGNRGFGPMNANNYGFCEAFEYTKNNHESL